MSDQPSPAAPSAEAVTPGSRLRREREKRGLSVQKAAEQMHLDAWVIEALEADRYASIGPPVYSRGHLKHYASILGISADEILSAYAASENVPVAAAPADQLKSASLAPALALPRWPVIPPRGLLIGAGAVVCILFGLLLWWKPWHSRHATLVARAPVVATAPIAAPVPTPVITSVDPPAVEGAGRASLTLSFSADCPVNVRDANGRTLFAGTGAANSVKVLIGEAPLKVYLGAASGVALTINGHAAAIAAQFVRGDAARFNAGADGVLRRIPREASKP